jgi:hypothetical protein
MARDAPHSQDVQYTESGLSSGRLPIQEVEMFARSVSFHLKPGRTNEFTQILERDVIPTLRKQKGFQDEITLIAPDGEADAVGISLWDLKESADAYARSAYSAVLKSMEKVLDGAPQVRTYKVSNSTFHKIAIPSTV